MEQFLRSLKNRIVSENGYGLTALMAVCSVIIILAIIGFALIPLTEGETSRTSRDTLSAQALYVAEAGVQDYLWHVNKDADYYKTTVHPAQGQDELGNDRWKDYGDGDYHIEVVENTVTPGVTIEVSGRMATDDLSVTRRVRAAIQKRGFTNYLYFTEYETVEGTGNKIWFITGDRLRGPVHSNDEIHISGDPVFEKKVTTSQTLDMQPGSDPSFEQGYEENAPQISMPPTNTSLKTTALLDGYYYYGMTTIELMPNGMLSITNSDGQPEGPTGIVSLPPNGVIYVDGMAGAKGSATNGDAFVEGTLSGSLTIASKNNIYITGDILYQNPADDMLGLIGENYIYILHYWDGDDVAPYNIEINAAIFAVNHSFKFEDHDEDPVKGTLTVRGSLGQKYRGAVGTFSHGERQTGYAKDYYYDQRMLYRQPPHFIEPLNSGFEVVSWEEF